MNAVVLVALWLGQVGATGQWASGRPPECADRHERAENVWERAKAPVLRRYCDLLASAASKLAGTATMAQAALESAERAEEILPGHAAPQALKGRALASLGRLDDALIAMRSAIQRDARAVDDPPALLTWARLLARTGHPEEARTAYRSLLPRATVLSGTDRASAAAEAGLVAMKCGAQGLDDAVASLRDATREAQDETQAVAVLALALALNRRGEGDQAFALLSDHLRGDPRSVLSTARAEELLSVATEEKSAMAALALENSDPGGARDAWQEYVEKAPSGPWLAHARARLAALAARRSAGRPRSWSGDVDSAAPRTAAP
jgi:tetratricopeptide (TPR) repeat protein